MDEMRILLCVVFGFGVVLESLLLVGFNAEELGIGFLLSLGAGLVFFYILALIPIPYTKEQSFRERWREVKKHAKVLIEKYSHQQLRQEEALLIVLILGGLLLANLLLQLIPDHLAINTLIVIVPQLISKRFSVAVQRSDELMSS